MKRDPGPTNLAFFGFARGPKPETMAHLPEFTEETVIPGRRGAAERSLTVRTTAEGVEPFRLEIATHGWYDSAVELNIHQARALQEILGAL